MKLESMNPDLARVYLHNNGIRGAFVWNDSPGWQVYIGNSDDACGWKETEFKTKREAEKYCEKLNLLIQQLI
jgi:hypothetical protein